MKEKIFGSIMLVLLLISTLNLAFFIKPSLAKNDEGSMFSKDSLEEAGEATVSKENSGVNQINGFDTTWRNVFETKPDTERSKASENPNQATRNTEDNWNFDYTNEWSNFAYLHGNKTRLIVGVNSEKPPSLLELDRILAKHQAEIVNKVSIGGELKAVVVELLLSSAAAFAQETRDAGLASYVEPNMKVQTQFVPNDPYWTYQWGPRKIEADWAWNTTIGSHDILVAVIDTGIDYTHLDLAANYVALGYDWVNNDNDPMDDHGHGTHCAGIIAGTLNNNIGIAGLAQVQITAEKVLDSGGGGYWDWVASGIIHAADSGADIISMSLAGYGYSELVHEAVRYAYDAGVLVIAAAANDNTNMKAYPAGYDEVVAVSATDEYDNKASFSNWGDWIELAAPGVSIYSTVPWGYESWSGTSMAAPHVSGIAALVWSLYPEKTREWVRLWLRYTADDLGDPGFDIYYGYGRINARKAVEHPLPDHELIAYDWKTPLYLEPGALGIINATVLNFGENNETDVTVQLFANDTIVNSASLDFLAGGDSTNFSLTWNPTIEGLYNVTLYLEPVLGEASIENNVVWKYIYVGFPVEAVVLHSAGNIISETITNWQLLNNQWNLFGDTMVYIDYTTLNKEDITYEDIASTEADVLIISCAYDPYAGWEFTDSEIEAITRYVHEGHGLIATAGTLYERVPNNNKLARLFGMNETTMWNTAGTDLLNLVNATHPIFAKVPNPLVFPQVGTALPSDGRWDQNELEGGEYLALGHYQESAIATFRGLVYISPWLEMLPPRYHHHLQLLYNTIMWSKYQKPEHELAVSLEVPGHLQPQETASLNATVFNLGLSDETNVELCLMIDSVVVGSATIEELFAGETYNMTYLWTPSAQGLYNITAYAPTVANEESDENNIASVNVEVCYIIARVAVLNSFEIPPYFTGGWSNDYQTLVDALNTQGFLAQSVTNTEIISGNLGFFDVFVMVDNVPSVATVPHVFEFWSSGGGIVAFDSSICFLCYAGILPPESAGSNGYYVYWDYGTSYQAKISAEHPITEGYEVGQIIYGASGDADYRVETLTGTSAYPYYTVLVEDVTRPNLAYVSAYEPLTAGNVVHIWDYSHWSNTNVRLMILNAMEWARTPQYDHDLAVSLGIPQFVKPDSPRMLNATVQNRGLNNETGVELYLLIDGTVVSSESIELLTGESYTIDYAWTPTIEGTYNVTAYAPPVENETFAANNKATKSVEVKHPLIDPAEGQYANYTMYYIDTSTGEETLAGLWNFTYLSYISPYQINITTWMEDQNSYTQTGWMIVNTFTRMVESDSGIYWTGMWYPGWIETGVTIGSTIDLLWGNATISDSRVVLVGGFPIDCWEMQLEQYGLMYTFWYDKASGLWIAMSLPSSYNLLYLVLTTTNVPLGFQYEHNLAVMLEAPARLSPDTSTTLNATVYNIGLSNEAEVALQLVINGSPVASEVVSELASGDFYTLNYTWTPTEGVYNLTVYSPPVVGEEYIENNVKTQMVNVRVVAVALISDHSELSAITYMLDSMGINYDIYNNNDVHLYAADLNLLLNYRAVVFYTDSRWITAEEAMALNSYLSNGGSLIVTGFDCLVSDALLADVVRSATMGDNVGRPELRVVDAAHPIMNGPYGSFPAGYYIEGLYGDCDRVEADSARGAVTVAELIDGYDKIIATEMLPGKVVFWNGRGDYDWTWNADCQAMFKNTIHWMTVMPEHELAVSLGVPAFLVPDVSATLNATVRNLGLNNETNVELQLWIDGIMVESEAISELLAGSSYALTYLWAPTVEGTYNITAYAPPVENEISVANNAATGFSIVAGPMIHPAEGQYANYTLYILDYPEGDVILGTEKWNFTYASYISSTQIYIEVWTRTQEGYEQSSWMVVNTVNRYVEAGMLAGTYYRGWIERDIDVGSTVRLESGYATVVGNRIVSVGIRKIDCWELLTDYGGIFWYDKTTGLWIGAQYDLPPNYWHRFLLDYTNVPIGFEHELSVALRAPSSLLGGTSTLLRATVYNLGLHDETSVELCLFIDGSIAASATIPELPAGTSYSVSYSWSPSEGQYDVTAYATPVPGEGYVENNIAAKTVRVFEVTGTYIYVDPLETTTIIGDTFTVTVRIVDVEDLCTWQTNLEFDPDILECTGAWYPAGHVFENRTFVSVDPSIDNVVGYVMYGSGLLGEVPGENVTEGILCRISFRAKGLGVSPLTFRLSRPVETFLGDSDLEDIPFTALGGVAEVVEYVSVVQDIAVIGVVPSATEVYSGWPLNITMTARNEGEGTATFTVSVYCNTSLIGAQAVHDLAPGENVTLTFVWNTLGLSPSSRYIIKAEASTLPGEINTDNNVFVDGTVRITMLGDTNGDGIIDMRDLFVVALAFGSKLDRDGWNQAADLNLDGIVDMRDMYIVARNFGKTSPP